MRIRPIFNKDAFDYPFEGCQPSLPKTVNMDFKYIVKLIPYGNIWEMICILPKKTADLYYHTVKRTWKPLKAFTATQGISRSRLADLIYGLKL